MMNKIYFPLITILVLVLVHLNPGHAQIKFKFFELHGGGQGGNLKMNETALFYAKTDSVYSGYFSLHAHLVSVFPLKKNPAIQFRSGVGFRSEFIYVFPLLPVPETGLSSREDLMIFEVDSWNNQLTFPMSVAAEVYLNKKAGLKFSLGFDQRIAVHQMKPIVSIVNDFDHNLQGGYTYYDESLKSSLSAHYAEEFRRYTITGNIGLAIIDYKKPKASIGFKTNHFLLSPFKSKNAIKKHGGFEFFLEISFW